MEFPDVYTSDFRKENNKLAKEAIDYAISYYNGNRQLRQKLQTVYDSFNGIIDPKQNETLTKPFGIESKTRYTHYNYGLNKIKTLIGEFLSTNIDPRVETIDDEHISKKFDKYLERKAFLEIKDELGVAKEQGYDVFPGILEQMEDEESFLSPENFKTENERLLTKYLIDKVKKDRLKLKFKQNLIDAVNTCMIFGKVDTVNGIDTYRRISPMNALFMDIDTEGFMEDSPYIGEKRLMYYHQVVKEFNIPSTDKKTLEKLKEVAQLEGLTEHEIAATNKGNKGVLIPVYTIEFKTIANVTYFKKEPSETSIIREMPEEEYIKNKKKYDKLSNEGNLEIIRVIHEEVWQYTRIAEDIYLELKKTERQANHLENRKLRARYNYIGMLMDTVEGVRVPIQHIISKLDRAYNDVMFLLNRELRKPGGTALGVNMGLLPAKIPYKQIMTELTDEGIIRFNTAAEGNAGNIDGRDGSALNGVQVGDTARVIDSLLRLKQDLKYSMDEITGINKARVGAELATTTATTAQNNLEASRTTTYDLFYNVKEFIDEVMTRLVEKGKLNFVENNPDLFGGIYDEEEFAFIRATSDIVFEHFAAYINDGRKELEIRGKIEGLFGTDIQSGNLRTKDVAKFYLQETLANGLKVLDNAWAEISKINSQSQQQSEQVKLQTKQMDVEMMQEDREDRQEHEIDKIFTKGEVDKEILILDKTYELEKKGMDNATKESVTDKKLSSDERINSVKSRDQAKNKK